MSNSKKTKEQLELEELRQKLRFEKIRLYLASVQAAAVIIGVTFATYEFVIKDRDAQNHKTKATLDYYGKTVSTPIFTAKRALERFRDEAYAVPVGNSNADHEMRMKIAESFEKETIALGNFYDVLLYSVENDVLDRRLAEALFVDEAHNLIDLLSEIQGRLGKPHDKRLVPPMKHFRGLIEYYRFHSPNRNIKIEQLPKYDINKPI